MRFLLLFLIVLSFFHCHAQEGDLIPEDSLLQEEILENSGIVITGEENTIETFEKKTTLDPKRAALLSAVVPGLGQIYNGHAWKVPIIYGGAALFGTWITYNNRMYQIFKNDELTILNFSESKLPSAPDLEFVQRNRERFRRNRDYAVIISMIFYAINIVDAHVSAHLKEFEVNEDLSLKIQPAIQPNMFAGQMDATYGLKLSLKFR